VSAAELCLADSVPGEADLLVEGKSVSVGGHIDARYPLFSRIGEGVEHEFRGDAAPHPVGVDEQVLEFTDLSGNQHRREADDSVVDDSDADSALRDRTIGELERVGMGEQARAIAFVRERRSSKQIAERGQIFHLCETNAKVGRIGRHHVPRVPDAAGCDLCGASAGARKIPSAAPVSPSRAR